jgi:uncharacterized protein DUF998
MSQTPRIGPARTPLLPVRLSGYCGLAMPLVFFPVVILLSWAEYDFMRGIGWSPLGEHSVNFPSSLARGEYGYVQILNFALAGMLSLAFVVGLRTQFSHRLSGWVATLALGAFGLAGLLNAFPTSLPGEPGGIANTLHTIGFIATMLGALIGIAAAGLALRGAPSWRGWWIYSVLTPPAVLVCFINPLGLPGDSPFYVGLVLMFGWFGAMGARLLRTAS